MEREKEGLYYGGSLEDLPQEPMEGHGGVTKRVVFGPGRFWDDHVVRYFTTEGGGKTPFHSHDWPHYVIILEGEARGVLGETTCDLRAGSWAYVPPDEEHCFENTGTGPLKFLCIVPRRGDPFDAR